LVIAGTGGIGGIGLGEAIARIVSETPYIVRIRITPPDGAIEPVVGIDDGLCVALARGGELR